MLITIIKIFALFHEFVHEKFSINLRGLGYLYRKITKDLVFIVKGNKLYFNHKISDNYGRLINGKFNEKETHFFLDNVFIENQNWHFVDIGGNVGEFVLDYSSNSNVNNVTVFEPQHEQQKAISKTIELNKFSNTKLINKPVSSKEEEILFNFNLTNSTASGITNDSEIGTKLMATTIDKELFDQSSSQNFVFLIDTEGAELEILKGGFKLIQKFSPLIIFEYNHVTKMHFKISDVQNFLGSNYIIYRLRKDGLLDLDFSKTWNLVAVPQNITFNHVNNLVKK
jgi:FkbM family methyltransferase